MGQISLEGQKPDAAICHARELFTRYQDMYLSSVRCGWCKERPAKLSKKSASCFPKKNERQASCGRLQTNADRQSERLESLATSA